MNDFHVPVLVKETIDLLRVGSGKKYIDCTLGGGGHTKAILEAGGKVLGIDQDAEAIKYVAENHKSEILDHKLVTARGNFAHLKEIALEKGFTKVDGILFDLGVSSHQLDTDYRGFSFNKDAPLDMRMDQELTVSAADLVNAGGESELAHLFWKYGEENWSRPIARAIAAERKRNPIKTTDQLASIILRVRRPGGKKARDRTHPATRVFQALRIAVNNELENLEMALPQALEILRVGGRLVVISFHSLEERIVKEFFKTGSRKLLVLTLGPVKAREEEIARNPRSRSARLRAAEKVTE